MNFMQVGCQQIINSWQFYMLYGLLDEIYIPLPSRLRVTAVCVWSEVLLQFSCMH